MFLSSTAKSLKLFRPSSVGEPNILDTLNLTFVSSAVSTLVFVSASVSGLAPSKWLLTWTLALILSPTALLVGTPSLGLPMSESGSAPSGVLYFATTFSIASA